MDLSSAKRIEQIQPSQTLAITALVDSLRRSGKDIVDLGAGEPDFDTPEVIKEAAIRAIHDGFTKYTPATGILELKEAICNKLKQDNDLDYSPPQVVVTCGAKHAVVNTLLALCDQGDEVIIPSPYWTSYIQQVNFVDARPVILETNDKADFKIAPRQLEEAITPKTKLLILNSPSNPTGCVYSQEELAEIAAVLEKTKVLILSDEIYEKIIYDDEEHISIASFPSLRDRVILINGVSKAYAMTGWRIGYMAANEAIIEAVSKVQSHSTSNACSISQKASLAALKAGPAIITEMVENFYERRNFLMSRLQEFPGIRCSLPKGAFYMFPNVSKYFGAEYQGKAIRNSTDFCSILLEDAGVAVVPGEAFGSENHVRISYATALENLKEAMERMGRTLRKLQTGELKKEQQVTDY